MQWLYHWVIGAALVSAVGGTFVWLEYTCAVAIPLGNWGSPRKCCLCAYVWLGYTCAVAIPLGYWGSPRKCCWGYICMVRVHVCSGYITQLLGQPS